jgi:hypothetical protein
LAQADALLNEPCADLEFVHGLRVPH